MLQALKRFSWSHNSAASHDNKKLHPENKSSQADGALRKTTEPEHISEAETAFLQILQAVAQDIPIPGIGPTIKVATNLVKVCAEVRATAESADELKLHLKTLVAVVVNELRGKEIDEIGQRLEDIELLQTELKYIEKRLDEIVVQRALLVFFRRSNNEKMKDCTSRVDGLLGRFNVMRQADCANLLDRLEKEITDFHNVRQRTSDHTQDVVEDTNVTIKDVKVILKNTLPATTSSSSGIRATIPASTSFFCGRDEIIFELVCRLTDLEDDQRHICLLGARGIGKTSTALAVMTDAELETDYPDGQRVWVPCARTTSTTLLLDTLASLLGVTHITGDVKENILFALKSADPLILVLDNFETLWDAHDERSEVERLLRDIDRIPHVTLFITMRSSTPPCKDLVWHSVDLEAVDAATARQIYSEIHQGGSADPQVPELLDLVGRVPLAIVLLARTAKLSGLSVKALIERYKETGEATLGHESDHDERRVNICSSIFVDSPVVNQNPEARWLLSALANLPAGTTYDMLSTWYAPRLSNLSRALEVLIEMSLVECQGSIISISPIIRHHIVDPSRLDVDVRKSVIASACEYLGKHESSPSETSYDGTDIPGLSSEEENLVAVISQVEDPSAEILDALLVLARYQAATRRRTNIVNHALKLAERLGDKSFHGAFLSCYGSACHNLGLYSEARDHYTEARKMYLSVSDRRQAAQCQLAILKSHIYDDSVSSATKNSIAIQAESEFESVRAMHSVAQCWLIRGINAYQDRDYDEALSLLHRAREKFVTFGSTFKTAECSRSISICHYRRGDFEQAKTWFERTAQEFSSIGSLADKIKALVQLGAVYNALGAYAIALRTLIECMEESKVSAGPVGLGLTLEYIGVAWLQQRKRKDARGAFKEAMKVYLTLPLRSDHVRCRYWLRRVEDLNAVPAYEEREILKLWYPAKALALFGVRI